MQPGTFFTWQDNDALHKEQIENTFLKMSLPFDKTLVCTDTVFKGRQEVEPIKCIVVLHAPGNQ